MSYYSLISSLPNLYIGCENPISIDDFINKCTNVLNENELNIIQSIFNNTYPDHKIINIWKNLDIQIKNNLVKQRAQSLKIDSKQYLKSHHGYNGFIDNSLSTTLVQGNPAEIEKEIDSLRFKLLEDLVESFFSFEKIIIYAIQLKIVIRWENMDEENGYENLEKIIMKNTTSEKIIV